jgi:hypothetical protein
MSVELSFTYEYYSVYKYTIELCFSTYKNALELLYIFINAGIFITRLIIYNTLNVKCVREKNNLHKYCSHFC